MALLVNRLFEFFSQNKKILPLKGGLYLECRRLSGWLMPGK